MVYSYRKLRYWIYTEGQIAWTYRVSLFYTGTYGSHTHDKSAKGWGRGKRMKARTEQGGLLHFMA